MIFLDGLIRLMLLQLNATSLETWEFLKIFHNSLGAKILVFENTFRVTVTEQDGLDATDDCDVASIDY